MRCAAARHLITISIFFSMLLFAAGCPHRSPVWSPDGKSILLLAGTEGEDVDKPASRLWLVDAGTGKAKRLESPLAPQRYLAAAWIDDASFLVFTADWRNDIAEPGTEKIWRARTEGGSWTELKAPAPSAERLTRRLPVVAGKGKEGAVVYPSADYLVLAVSLETGKEVFKLDPADLVGPGPQGGFIATRPEPENPGNIEVVAFSAAMKEVWRKKYSDIQEAIAKKLGKMPGDVAFNDTSTCHVAGEGDGDELGLNFVFSDVGWKDGIPGYHVRLDATTGDVRSAVHGVGLPGRAASSGGGAWAVLAPDMKSGAPPRVQVLDLKTGSPSAEARLEKVPKEAVQGYSLDPAGKRFALSLRGPRASLRIYETGKLESPRVIELEE